VPALIAAFPEFAPDALTVDSQPRAPPPVKVHFENGADDGVARALATFPVRPRLRCVSFPFFSNTTLERGDDTHTFISR
jgi:hypothetical protein